MRRSAVRRAVLAVVALAVAGIPASSASTPASARPDDLDVPEDRAQAIADAKVDKSYIVTMADEPAVTYDGGTAGLPATAPDRGDKLATTSAAVKDYRAYLNASHNAALDGAGIARGRRLYQYSVTTNGFSVRINGRQAEALRRQPGVVSVVPDQKYQVDTITTPKFLGLSKPGGPWDQGYDGENVVVGIVDTGIWPESASFSDTLDGEIIFPRPTNWNGTCTTGEDFNSTDCNNKLIGARYYAEGWGGEEGIHEDFPYEYFSARDADGHGSHTASTAAGRKGVPVVIEGQSYGKASGMAPRARVAAYKVCWGRGGEGGCFGSDSIAAIDQAVADGVDVINFSISGTSTNFVDPVEMAFLRASNAGVFVAASAGNSGPSASTVAHPSPWITTVAASTHDRLSEATLTTGDGTEYTGPSAQKTGTPELPMVYAGDVPAEGADPEEAALCFPDSLDPEAVEGTMVVCDRGVNARTEKSLAVRDAGGEAMVLVNPSPNSVNGDIHFVPSIHLDSDVRAALLAYIDGASPTGQLSPGVTIVDETAPQTAAFSSRGPLLASSDLLKPDITAPGVDVLAAVSPDGYNGRNYDLISGTSMSSPHMAGLAAVLKDAHNGWMPSELKSALMTTAYDVEGASPFDVGSGHVHIKRALGPTLVYPTGVNEYLGFLCGQELLNLPEFCFNNTIEASNLNQPNIAVGELAGRTTVHRKVRNVTKSTATFAATVTEPPGVDVLVRPRQLTLGPNDTGTFRVTFTSNDDAVFDEYTFGKLSWKRPDRRKVESELVVRPVELAAPDEVSGTGTSGSGEFDITFGYNGEYEANAHGLEPANRAGDTVQDDPGNDINGAIDCYIESGGDPACGITLHDVTVPAGTALARFSLFDAFTDGDDDLDLYVFDPDGVNVGASGSGTSEEQVDVANPDAGSWLVVVHGWQTDGPDADYTLFDWSVLADPTADDGSLVVDSAPSSASVGETGTVEYSWSGIAADNKYLGAISHSNGTDLIGLTLVSVDAYATE